MGARGGLRALSIGVGAELVAGLERGERGDQGRDWRDPLMQMR